MTGIERCVRLRWRPRRQGTMCLMRHPIASPWLSIWCPTHSQTRQIGRSVIWISIDAEQRLLSGPSTSHDV